MNTTKAYLTDIRRFQKKHRKKNGWDYFSIEDFLLSNGRHMPNGKLPKGLKRGKMKERFLNAFYLAEKKGYTYCEGFAFSVAFPMYHAWCMYKGKVVDPTWTDGKYYFGVEIPLEQVIRIMFKSKYFAVLDAWQIGFPFLTGEEKL